MSLTDNGSNKQGIKTIAFRFRPDLHAQISLIASLRSRSLQDEVMTAIDAHVATSKTDPDLLQKVEQAQAKIEQEAKDRRATIAGLFEAPAPDPEPASSTATSGRPAKTAATKPAAKP